MLQGFDNMFHVIYAYEWMNNAHVHEIQVQLCKPNTRGVTKALPSAVLALGKDLTLLADGRRRFFSFPSATLGEDF